MGEPTIRSDNSYNESTYNLVSELKTKGFLKLGRVFNDSVIEVIRSKFNHMIDDDKYSFASSEYLGKVYNRQIRYNPSPIPELANLLTSDMISLLEALYGGHFQVKRVTASRNYHIPPEILSKKELLSSNWHCDRNPIQLWKLFVLLLDVTDENGPTHIQSKERTKELIKKGFGSRADYKLPVEALEDTNYVVKLTGPPGTVMIANTELCLHRAGVPTAGKTRDLVMFQFEPSSQPLMDDWLYHPDLDPKYD